MVQGKEVREVAVRTAGGAVATKEDFGSALTITPEYVERQKQSLVMLRQLVNDVLVQDRDYGSTPGIADEYLWEPGASQIIGAFNSHTGQPRVIKDVDDGRKIVCIIEVPIVSFNTGQEVGSGVGAASTLETKHKYRWAWKSELTDWGYDTKEAIDALKTRKRGEHSIQYRVPNPEHDDLVNTIWKIAFKRAKVAAAKGLPGVSSALAERLKKKDGVKGEKKSSDPWGDFWAQMKQRGLDNDRVHALLHVESIKDFVKDGRTAQDAVTAIDQALAAEGIMQAAGAGAVSATGTVSATGALIISGVNITDAETLMSDIRWTARDLIGAVKFLKFGVEVQGTTAEIFKALSPVQAKQLLDYMQSLADKKAAKK